MQLSLNSDSVAAKYIVNQIERLDQKAAELKANIDSLKDEKEATLIEQMNIDLVNQSIRDFSTVFNGLDINEKRKYLKNIIKEITWDGNAVHISIHGA